MKEKKISIFKRLENNVLAQFIFFVVSMVVIVGAYVGLFDPAGEVGIARTVRNAEEIEDYNVLVLIEDTIEEEEMMGLSGCIMRQGGEVLKVHLLLKEVDEKEEIVLTTKTYPQENSKLYGEMGWVGFVSETKKKKIRQNACYEILVYLEYKESGKNTRGEEFGKYSKKIKTQKYLYNGEVYDYNPEMFESPQFKDFLLQEVVNNGDVYYHSSKDDLWIYGYQGMIYWIAGPDFAFDETGQTYIPYQIHTNETEKLPSNMQETKFDNKDFKFEEFEMDLEENNSMYRVSRKALPTDYMITWIRTGIYDSLEQKWKYKISIPFMGKTK